jgi:arylsulfatase A-like enzyme
VAALRRLVPLLAVLALLSCGRERPVRVVLVTLDTLRYDALVGRAGAGSSMPHLLERSRGGALFERFYAATSVTQPSHASMLTALAPWEHGVTSNGQVLPEPVVTVAEVLREAGFATAAAVASFPVAGRFGFAQGFDVFSDDFTEHPVADRRWEGHDVPGDRFYSLADTVTDRALGMLERADAAPPGDQFFWFHYFDAHDPYGAAGDGPRYSPRRVFHAVERGRNPEPLLRRFHAAYEEDVRFLDGQLERLLSRLDADADRFETHVVIASDHGESFGEGGAVAHGMRLTEEQIHVPLVILSSRVKPGVRSDVAGSVDVAATLLSLAGVASPGPPWTGARDLTAPAAAGRAAGGAVGMRRTFGRRRMVELRTDGTRHVLPEYLFYAVDAQGGVYRGNRDGLEERPPGAGEEDARRVVERFAAFADRVARGPAPAPLDPEAERALRALGYVQ